MAYLRAYVKGAFESLVQMDFNQMNASCITQTTSHTHAMFMHHNVAYACV